MYNVAQNFNKKVRISMGASSTTKLVLLTGPPLTAAVSFPLSPSTCHTIFFISDFSWLVDKLTSFNSFICRINNQSPRNFYQCFEENFIRKQKIVFFPFFSVPFSGETVSSVQLWPELNTQHLHFANHIQNTREVDDK